MNRDNKMLQHYVIETTTLSRRLRAKLFLKKDFNFIFALKSSMGTTKRVKARPNRTRQFQF